MRLHHDEEADALCLRLDRSPSEAAVALAIAAATAGR
jgi:hypothetical protein